MRKFLRFVVIAGVLLFFAGFFSPSQAACIPEPCKWCQTGSCITSDSPPNCCTADNLCSTNNDCITPTPTQPPQATEPCKACIGNQCKPTNINGCSNLLNECSTNLQCGGGATPTNTPTPTISGPTPTPIPQTSCSLDTDCFSNAACTTAGSGYAWVKSWNNCDFVTLCPGEGCINSENRLDFCCANGTSYYNCIVKSNCQPQVCHPTGCTQVSMPGCLSTGGIGNFDGCNYSCGGCSAPTPTPGGGGGGSCQGLNKVCITNSNCCSGLCNQSTHRCVNPTPTPTPTPAVGTIRSRAMVITNADTSCAAVLASTTGLAGTVHQFTAGSASQPAPQTQSGSTYAQFNSIIAGSYTLDPVAPAGYALKRACWAKTLGGSSGEGLSQTLSASDTLTWNLGYTLGDAWVQVNGGDVYASGTITSLTPQGASPRLFDLDGDGGDPGVVTYGSSYDFAIETTGNDPLGVNQVSNNKWLVNETYQTINWFDTFFQRFGAPTVVDYDCTISPCTITKPASQITAYYVTGDMTTSGNWTITDGESIVFIVTGDLTLGGSINITGKGFVGFVVNGDIAVSSSVGSLYSDATPDIEGVYITSPTGTFATGASSVVNKERLVLKGTFVAGNFLLERDLASVGHNDDTSAELFIYNPMLLITMPEAMKEIKVAWQEVAP